jgi:hypothetical protein
MQFLSFYKPKTSGASPGAEQSAKMNAFMEEMRAKGHFLFGGGFLSADSTFSVSLAEGGYGMRDQAGPAMDGFGGFALLQASSKEELIAISRRFLDVAGDGECLVRPLMDGPPPQR